MHDAAREDPQEGKHLIDTAKLDEETKARLMKEWERVSKWWRPEKEERVEKK